MQIKLVSPAELKPAEYNPRSLTKDEAAHLHDSLTRFGFVEPIVANSAPGRENVVIGGHQRLSIALAMGLKQVPVHFVSIPDVEKEIELNLRLNKNVGHWDADMLANLDVEQLLSVGFTQEDLKDVFPEDIDDISLPESNRGFRQMTFIVSEDQAREIEGALKAAKDKGPFVDTGNENSNGNALARICEGYK
jgi:ParB-like chromosome segregation protein Spo0J